MAKPFVVMLPAVERESLRNAGVIPAGSFRSFETEIDGWEDDGRQSEVRAPSIYLWPFDVRYAESGRLVADIEKNPADIAAFFGVGAASDDAERRHNERLVAKLLGAVCVHVVFLDRKQEGTGYAAFGSFAEIAQWSRDFRKALDIRFANTPAFHNSENVLVIIARGQQVKASAEELADFSKCVGNEPDCTFKSCYYMDYNLRVGTTGKVIHAADVWDVMVSRLLLAFALSREGVPDEANSQHTCWQRPGIKIWRAQECHVGIEGVEQNAFLNDALSLANSQLQNWMEDRDTVNLPMLSDDDGNAVSIEGVDPLETDGEDDDPEWRSQAFKSWTDFSARRCAEGTADCDGRRWKKRFEAIRKRFSDWKAQHRPGERLPDARAVFSGVGTKPGLVFKGTERLIRILHGNRERIAERLVGGKDSAESAWLEVAEAESERRRQLERLAEDGEAFDLARKHYAGWLPGMIVFVSVSVMFGWVIHRIVFGLGGGIATSLVLAGASAVGAMSAVALVLFLHGRAGRRGACEIHRESIEADRLMVKRDNRVRKMVENALEIRRQLSLRALRFRVWALLERVKTILETEIQSKGSAVTLYDGEDIEENVDLGDADAVKKGFCRATNRQLGVYAPDRGPETMTEVMNRVELWWSVRRNQEEGSRKENFKDLWERLCKRDRECAGHYPARLFAHEIRGFVARFTDDLRHMEEELIIRDNLGELKNGLEQWFRDVVNGDSYLWATGSVTGAHVNERAQSSPTVYFEPDPKLSDLHVLEGISSTNSSAIARFNVVHSDFIGVLPQMAFMFQEYQVEFASDETTGNLVFGEVSDAV